LTTCKNPLSVSIPNSREIKKSLSSKSLQATTWVTTPLKFNIVERGHYWLIVFEPISQINWHLWQIWLRFTSLKSIFFSLLNFNLHFVYWVNKSHLELDFFLLRLIVYIEKLVSFQKKNPFNISFNCALLIKNIKKMDCFDKKIFHTHLDEVF